MTIENNLMSKSWCFIFLLLMTLTQTLLGQDRPKLVVAVVVDQMRHDYLSRYWDKFGENGFKRLVNEGFNFENNHYNYLPTKTAPGHASIFTGTTPMNHGIIGNNWYDRENGAMVYCVGDTAVSSVGTSKKSGKMSPHRLNANTFADENRIHTQMRGKTISISLKDRGAVLPGGHTANGAYWFFGGDEGVFITSSYYRSILPGWVNDFNDSRKVVTYLRTWDTKKQSDTYVESIVDANPYEGGFKGKAEPAFPYDLHRLKNQNGMYDILMDTPFGNDLTLDFALAAIEGENLGEDGYTDVLTISFSSTDKIGHNFGVDSKELEDAYLRLDENISRFLEYLDEKLGANEYLFMLTADHGGTHVPAYLKSLKVPAGYFNMREFKSQVVKFSEEEFKTSGIIDNISNNQVFLNHDAISRAGHDFEKVVWSLHGYILNYPQVDKIFTRYQLEGYTISHGTGSLAQLGFHFKRSGDLQFVLEPGILSYRTTGSTHGDATNYDTHVPLIFYGKGIPGGSAHKRSHIVDIAPTICAILGISFPNSSTGDPLWPMLDLMSNNQTMIKQ